MPSQIFTSSNGLLPTMGSPTTLTLRGECALLPEEVSGDSSVEADLPETQINHERGADIQASSGSEQLEDWAFLNEEVTWFCAGPTRAQSRGSSDWSSLASSTLAAPKLEVDFPPSAAPSNFGGGDTPIPSQGTDLTPIDPGPPTWQVTGSYSRGAYETAEPSCSEPNPFDFGSEPIHTLRFVPGPLPFGSEPAIYSFSPHPSSSQEPTGLFSQGPISSFSGPALPNIRPFAFSGATLSSISGPGSLQTPRSACSSPGSSPRSPSMDPPTLYISSSQWPYPPFCSRNTPSRPGYLLPNEPCLSFAPGPASSFSPEHDYSTGPGPSYSFGPGPSSSSGPGPSPFAPGPTSNCPGRSDTIGPGRTSPIRPGPFPFFGHGPSADSGLLATDPGPSSESLQQTVHTTFIGPGQAFSIRPGPFSSFGSGPSNVSELSATGPGPSSESVQQLVHSAYIGPGRTSLIRPGPFSSFESGPSNDSDLSAIGPGPSSSFDPGPSSSFDPGPSSSFDPGPSSSFDPGPSSAFGSELSTCFKQDPSLDYSSPIGDISFVSFSPGPSELPLGPGPSSILVNHTSVTREAEKRFLCAPCKRGFDRAELLERHKATKSHANTLVAQGIPLDPLPSPTVSCPFCDHIFNRPDNLRPHLLRHMGCDNQTRTRKVSVEDSIRMGLAHIDPRCAR